MQMVTPWQHSPSCIHHSNGAASSLLLAKWRQLYRFMASILTILAIVLRDLLGFFNHDADYLANRCLFRSKNGKVKRIGRG